LQQIKVQGLSCKKRQNTGVQLQFTKGFDCTISDFSDQIENGHSHRTNGTVLRSCSSPSSSGAVSGSNGFEAVSNG